MQQALADKEIVAGKPAGRSDPVWLANERLARTINIGLGFDSSCIGWGLELTEEYFDLCAAAGFTAVRLPVNVVSQTQTQSPYRIRPELLDRVSWVIDQATRRDVTWRWSSAISSTQS